MQNYTRFEWRKCKITLVSSEEDAKLHSFRVKNMQNYTRFEWRICKITLVSSGEDSKLHSFRVEKIQNYTRFEWRRYRSISIGLTTSLWNWGCRYWSLIFVSKRSLTVPETTLETGGEDWKLHSKRVGKIENYTRNEWGRNEYKVSPSNFAVTIWGLYETFICGILNLHSKRA